MRNRLINFLLPPRCQGCGDLILDPQKLCAKCWQKITFISQPFCQLCGFPLEIDILSYQHCEMCEEQKPEFDWARSAVIYDAGAKSLILRFKHADATDLSPILGSWLAHLLKEEATFDYVIPVPLHWLRLLKRRYNQSALLTLILQRYYPQMVFAPQILRRYRHTESQGHKTKKERYTNLVDAFWVPKRYQSLLVEKQVLLVDDVMTSGATLNACAKILKAAGCQRVCAISIARVI